MASFILRQVDNAIAKAKDAAKEAERAQHQADIDELAAMDASQKAKQKGQAVSIGTPSSLNGGVSTRESDAMTGLPGPHPLGTCTS